MLAEQWARENNFKFTPIDAEMQYEKFGMKEFYVFRDPNEIFMNDRQNPLGPARSASCIAAGSTHHFTPKIMVSNVMSLVPKMCEGSEFILRNQVSLAFITES